MRVVSSAARMWARAALLGSFALGLFCAPAAVGARHVSVGYNTPAALRGLEVLTRIDSLHVAEISTSDVAGIRLRPGIRWVRATVPRQHLGETLVAAPRGITAIEWEFGATRSNLVPANVARAATGITIAVVDTGADLAAPTLAAKAPITHNAVTGDSAVSDATGHGTFVASIAAGSVTGGFALNGFGGDAKLMIVQANRSKNAFDDVDEAAGIVWAVDNGAKIVNLSIGGADTSQVERDAIEYAISHGVLLVAAAGNSGQSGNVPSYPAALLGPHGLAVGASTTTGKRAGFSTVSQYISLAAPGVRVLGATTGVASTSTYPRVKLAGQPGLYAFGSGTSYSAPQVSGAAALVWAANPSLAADDVVQILEQTATGAGTWNSGTGYGVLDVAAAVARALGVPVPAKTG
jgi:subtilisin family serine protease